VGRNAVGNSKSLERKHGSESETVGFLGSRLRHGGSVVGCNAQEA
jgi:hypothetical protein